MTTSNAELKRTASNLLETLRQANAATKGVKPIHDKDPVDNFFDDFIHNAANKGARVGRG